MMNLKKHIIKLLIFCLASLLIFFSSFINLSAEEIDWIEVARTNDGIQFIDTNSIQYNNRGFLSVLIKFSEISPVDQEIINTNSYLMAVDCENRLFSKLPVNGELKQVKNWENPINNKLIKMTIINTCSY
tara:strand:+ start:199 stop:588 length:390 start_codon:yes stop_codon:yes gene_type:complete